MQGCMHMLAWHANRRYGCATVMQSSCCLILYHRQWAPWQKLWSNTPPWCAHTIDMTCGVSIVNPGFANLLEVFGTVLVLVILFLVVYFQLCLVLLFFPFPFSFLCFFFPSFFFKFCNFKKMFNILKKCSLYKKLFNNCSCFIKSCVSKKCSEFHNLFVLWKNVWN